MTSVTMMDGRTAEAIRDAVAAASAGRTNDARRIAERALNEGGEPATLNAFLGTLHLRTGDLESGIRHLRAASAAKPSDPVIGFNLANALTQQGSYLEAFDLIQPELAQADPSLRLLRLRGFLAQQLERFEEATACYERVLEAAPDDWELWNNLGNARRGAGDAPGAIEALRRAAEHSPDVPPIRFNYATALVWAGRPDQAEREFRAMADDFPDDWRPLRELHLLLLLQGREDEATEPLERAVQRDPENVELILGLAAHLLARQQHAAAEQMYRRALTIEPANPIAYLGVATVFDLMNRLEELATLVAEAEKAEIGSAGLSFIRAYDHRRAKRYAEGLKELLKVPDELETARRQQLLGQLLEGTGDYDGAFAAFERMNTIMRDDPSQPDARGARYRELIRHQRDTLTPAWLEFLQPSAPDRRASPVFLVGFPRSGTTLLDTILMGHPGIEVLEEEPMLANALQALGGFEALADASAAPLAAARDVYFETVKALASLRARNLLIDKNPLVMNEVPLMQRLFPGAKIILALRHPCDVVLSCFVTNFKLNNGMASFLQLETAAELYDLSFSYFERACELLKPPVHQIAYENVVEDRDRELRPLFEFLGLEWDDRVLDHQSTARSRGHIKTASYAQVIEPIYKRSSGRWRNYRKYLEPVFPILEPWVRKFGYEF